MTMFAVPVFSLAGASVLNITSGVLFWSLGVAASSVIFTWGQGAMGSTFSIGDWEGVLILLSGVILMLMVAGTSDLSLHVQGRLFQGLHLVLFVVLGSFFSCTSSVWFYLYFESSALLIFTMVLGWGYQAERVSAGKYLLFYTAFSSLPLIGGILYLSSMLGVEGFHCMAEAFGGSGCASSVWLWVFILSFLVKFPMYFFHIWLPKAHVEASAGGSMLLAGVLLKMGGHGVYRWGVILSTGPSHPLVNWALCGGVLVSLICLRQSDFKVLIAFSSVAHMGGVIAALLTKSSLGVYGALLIMVAHGVSSSLLFFLSGVVYSALKTRQLVLLSGQLGSYPSLAFFWGLGAMANMGVPPLVNFWGELAALVALCSADLFLLLPMGVMMFLAGGYSMLLFGASQGSQSSSLDGSIAPSGKELVVGAQHVFMLFSFTFAFSALVA